MIEWVIRLFDLPIVGEEYNESPFVLWNYILIAGFLIWFDRKVHFIWGIHNPIKNVMIWIEALRRIGGE